MVETLKLIIPQQAAPARRLIGFRNGVLDTQSGLFSPHSKSHWLRTLCGLNRPLWVSSTPLRKPIRRRAGAAC
ncbi:hypothetical protein [Klebsiella pneumoniae]|uniref:hypothetical protein n=1 Tax=Klebsiella pneumoniae TaxID=573 RepID=UPI00396F5BFD